MQNTDHNERGLTPSSPLSKILEEVDVITTKGKGYELAEGDQIGYHAPLLKAVEAVNTRQKTVLFDKLASHFGGSANLRGKTVAVWGLSFKPNTDDMREASSRVLIKDLLDAGATVTAYDPVAMDEAKRIFEGESRLSYAKTANGALKGADALVVVTEWKEFRSPDFKYIREALKQPVIIDGRNLYEPQTVKESGLEYGCIGRVAG